MPPRPPAASARVLQCGGRRACNGGPPSLALGGGAASFPAAREASWSAAVASPHAVVCESLRRMQTRSGGVRCPPEARRGA